MVGGHPKPLSGPNPQIDLLAAGTAERPERVLGRVDTGASTFRAVNRARCVLRPNGWRLRWFHEQSVSSKDASSGARCNLVSSPMRINLTDTINLLPLISGTKPEVSSSLSRSS